MVGTRNGVGVGWGWALIRGWALIKFFCVQDGRLFMVGAYSRWALIRGWALIRINTVFSIFSLGLDLSLNHQLWWNLPNKRWSLVFSIIHSFNLINNKINIIIVMSKLCFDLNDFTCSIFASWLMLWSIVTQRKWFTETSNQKTYFLD